MKTIRSRRGEIRADVEQVGLNAIQLGVDCGIQLTRSTETQNGVELVDRAVGFYPRIVLGDAAAAEERGLAFVAGPSVDLHSDSSCRMRSLTTISARSGITSHAMLRTTVSDMSCTTRRAMRSTCSSESSLFDDDDSCEAADSIRDGSGSRVNGTSSAAAAGGAED